MQGLGGWAELKFKGARLWAGSKFLKDGNSTKFAAGLCRRETQQILGSTMGLENMRSWTGIWQ